jgi:hypothetical protein
MLTTIPNPKFAISAANTGANFGFNRTPEIYDSRVGFGSEALLNGSQQG